MQHKNEQEQIEDGVLVAAPAWMRLERPNRYGPVPGLDEEELASPAELEHQVFLDEWGPVLALPVRGRANPITPNVDEYFGVDWGAFGTVDFERTMPAFDKSRYRLAMLREELRDVLIRLDIALGHVPGKAKYGVLKYLGRGLIGLDQIADVDLLGAARLYLRAKRLRGEIGRLAENRRARAEALAARLWGGE